MIEFVAGIITMSVFTMLAIIAFDDKNTALGFVLSGPVVWVCVAFYSTCNLIRNNHRHRKYKASMLDPNGEMCYCNSSEEPEYLQTVGYTFNNSLSKNIALRTDGRKNFAS